MYAYDSYSFQLGQTFPSEGGENTQYQNFEPHRFVLDGIGEFILHSKLRMHTSRGAGSGYSCAGTKVALPQCRLISRPFWESILLLAITAASMARTALWVTWEQHNSASPNLC